MLSFSVHVFIQSQDENVVVYFVIKQTDFEQMFNYPKMKCVKTSFSGSLE